jgi:hypothetical protein
MNKMKQSDLVNIGSRFQVIGISSFLISGAPGHYESFHKALFQGLQSHNRVEKSSYLGSRQNQWKDDIWYMPLVPSSLTRKFKVADLKYFKTLLDLAKTNSSNSPKVFVAYEGGLYTVYLLSALLRFRPNTIAIVNIFDNQQHARLLESKLNSRIFRAFLKIAMRGVENQLALTGDTFRFASKMQDSTKTSIDVFPMFSILQPSNTKTRGSREFLINLRGSFSANKLLEVCKLVGIQNLPEITVHGPIPDQIKIALTQFDSLKFSEGHISESNYQSMFLKFKSVVFLYNPESFSYCSSGRLFDAIVSESKLIVPSDTALADFAKVYGNASAFDFNKITELADIFLGKSKFSRKSNAQIPTVQNAIQSLILIAEKCRKKERSTNLSINFWIVATLGWLTSQVVFLLCAVKSRVKYKIMLTFGKK